MKNLNTTNGFTQPPHARLGFTTTSEGENESLFSFFPSAVGAKLASSKQIFGFTTASEKAGGCLRTAASNAAGANAHRAFTLIELLVVIAIISLLSSVVLASLNGARESARDARRLQDMQQIRTALELYYNDNGQYPEENSPSASLFEESNRETNFLNVLVSGGYLANHVVDPINDADNNYRYYRYGSGGNTYGCDSSFYVLGIDNMETSDGVHEDSPGWECPERDWETSFTFQFDWVTGSLE